MRNVNGGGRRRNVLRMRRRMTTNTAKARVRERIRARLEELGMTGREVAWALGKSDSWISGILHDEQGLQLEDLDAVAEYLRLSPTELVRYDDSELRELRPHEMRLLRHYQQWPWQIQERWLRVLDYFAITTPDQDIAKMVDRLRDMSPPKRRRLRRFLDGPLPDTLQLDDEPASDPLETVTGTGAPDTTRPLRHDETPRGGQRRDGDR